MALPWDNHSQDSTSLTHVLSEVAARPALLFELCRVPPAWPQVKLLLEEGTFLQRAMFEGVINHIAAFVNSTGMRKHNKCVAALLVCVH